VTCTHTTHTHTHTHTHTVFPKLSHLHLTKWASSSCHLVVEIFQQTSRRKCVEDRVSVPLDGVLFAKEHFLLAFTHFPTPYLVYSTSQNLTTGSYFYILHIRLIYSQLLASRVWMRRSLTKERQSCVTELSTNQLRGFGDCKYSPVHFEVAFGKLWGANINFVMCVCPSFRRHGTNIVQPRRPHVAHAHCMLDT